MGSAKHVLNEELHLLCGLKLLSMKLSKTFNVQYHRPSSIAKEGGSCKHLRKPKMKRMTLQ